MAHAHDARRAAARLAHALDEARSMSETPWPARVRKRRVPKAGLTPITTSRGRAPGAAGPMAR